MGEKVNCVLFLVSAAAAHIASDGVTRLDAEVEAGISPSRDSHQTWLLTGFKLWIIGPAEPHKNATFSSDPALLSSVQRLHASFPDHLTNTTCLPISTLKTAVSPCGIRDE